MHAAASCALGSGGQHLFREVSHSHPAMRDQRCRCEPWLAGAGSNIEDTGVLVQVGMAKHCSAKGSEPALDHLVPLLPAG